jgi:fatty-acyl-CoA synthase
MLCQGEVYGLAEADVVMPVVPMFHAGAWGLPYAAWQSGADLVLPGAHAGDASRLLDLIEDECVTFLAAVPTVWLRLVEEQKRSPRDVSSLRAIVSGGAALPAALAQSVSEVFGVDLWQGWGMTETGPLAAISKVPPDAQEADSAGRAQRLATQGRAVPGMRIKLRSVESGAITDAVPGSSGEILARSPWTATRYIDGEPAADRFLDGWVRSGDIATVDEYGALRIVDRLKDLIKSGGEWISSLELESALVGCPGVREAAVVGAQDDEWGERPAAFVVTDAESPGALELKVALRNKVPRWWIPETFVFCDEIARTSVGKYDKRALREQLQKLDKVSS